MASLPIGTTTLLLFTLGLTAEDGISPLGTIPGHGPSPEILSLLSAANASTTTAPGEEGAQKARMTLGQHFCLAASTPQEVVVWEERLKELKVKILGTREWERGGRSVYFEGLDGEVGEVGSRGIWKFWRGD